MASRVTILSIPTAILIEISCFLDIKSFLRFRITCKGLKKLTCSEGFFKIYLRNVSALKFLNLKPEISEAETFYSRILYPLSRQLNFKKVEPLDLKPIESSTSDGDQFIYTTAHDSQGFWGSLGTADENKEEYLFYRLEDEFAVPTMVIVEFIYFSYVHHGGIMIGNPLFPSKFIQVEFSLVPDKPIYTSPKYEIKDKVKDTIIKIPILPNLLAARYMKVKFYGMQCKHTLKDHLYYLCVESVVCYGYNSEYEDESGNKLGKFLTRATENFYSGQKPLPKASKPKDIMLNEEEEEQKKSIENEGKMVEESEEESPSLELVESGYDLAGHNATLMEKAKGLKDLEGLLSFIGKNLQLLEYRQFYEYLADNEELAIGYIISKSKRHSYLDVNETVLLMELAYDFENNEVGKHGSLATLFQFFLIREQACSELIAKKLGMSSKLKNIISNDDELVFIDSYSLKNFLRKKVAAARKIQKKASVESDDEI